MKEFLDKHDFSIPTLLIILIGFIAIGYYVIITSPFNIIVATVITVQWLVKKGLLSN